MGQDATRDLGGERRRSQNGVRELVPGERIHTWDIIKVLGGGGFGTVYEVRDARNGRRAALKLMHAHFVASPEMLARFDREISVLRRMTHPNIVNLIEAGFSADQRPYLCMELLEGEELSKIVTEKGPLDPHLALSIFEPLCEALAKAHELNIIHRDVKASNVLVCRPENGGIGRVVLLDFGIAKLADALSPELTATGQSLGTPSCMAPEQIHGQRVDGRTDVYALGGLLFYMLTGRLPFQDSSATMIQYLHLHARRPNISSIVSAPRRLDDVIACAMAINPADRFPDPRALLAATRSALRDTAVMPVPTGEIPCVALMVTTADRSGGAALDAALLDDLEAVMPAAQQLLSTSGFQLAVDLGATALFVARAELVGDPVAIASAVFDQLQRRRGRDSRVRIGVCVHRDAATFVGSDIQPGPLLRPATWNLPEDLEGVWVTNKIDASAPTGRCVRS
ncbi:MAG: serine/threonine protein kinase [Deltaproteobacteria bacterium]|nr:serine/threonine protein kinase [Deltaproteobacteria bacterium]